MEYKFLQVKLSPEVHKRFKILCDEQDITMSTKVKEWINKFIKGIDKMK